MKPKRLEHSNTDDLFRTRLENIIDMDHALVRLAERIDWGWLEESFAPLYADDGRPGNLTRFMAGLHILKHVHGLSDEEICDRWVENPYFQHFTGEEYFCHALPHDRSSMTHWRTRVGDEGLAKLVQESLRIAHDSGAIRTKDLKRVTVDTTVQPKAITFPTDAKLIYRAIVRLGALSRKHGVKLRQSYVRVGKLALIKTQHYAHAKQFKRHKRQVRFLKVGLGRVIRDIARKIDGDDALEAIFHGALQLARRVRDKKKRQEAAKVYSLHAPEVECIGKGKAHKPYEFGCKVSVATTNACAPGGQFVTHIKALHGNPYDGHTLAPVIGHMKEDGLLGRNHLHGRDGDKINAVLAGAGHNFRLLIRWFRDLLRLFLKWLLQPVSPQSA